MKGDVVCKRLRRIKKRSKVMHHDINTVVPVNNSNTGPDSDDSTDYDNYLPPIPILSQLLETAKGDSFSYVTDRPEIR